MAHGTRAGVTMATGPFTEKIAGLNGPSAFAPNTTPSRVNRLGGGLSTLAKGILGYADSERNRKIAGNDYMNQAYATGLSDVQDRANKYQQRYDDVYNKLGDRPNLFRNIQQENARRDMLANYLGSYGGRIGQLASMVPSKEMLQSRQLEDLRNQTFRDSTYMPTDMFNEYYGNEGQSIYGMELGLPQNGLMQSGVSGGRQINTRMNDEFDQGITNSSELRKMIMDNLQQNSRTASKKTFMDRLGLTASLGSAILGMMKPTALG